MVRKMTNEVLNKEMHENKAEHGENKQNSTYSVRGIKLYESVFEATMEQISYFTYHQHHSKRNVKEANCVYKFYGDNIILQFHIIQVRLILESKGSVCSPHSKR